MLVLMILYWNQIYDHSISHFICPLVSLQKFQNDKLFKYTSRSYVSNGIT